jgi:prepilin signal peptidase PulO-like enzyme (type II secretory pathway)
MKLVIALFFASTQGALLGYLHIMRRRRAQAAAAPKTPEPEPTTSEAEQPPPQPEAEPEEEEWVPDETAVPFGPFLLLGALETILWGDATLHLLHLDVWAPWR